MAKRINVRRVLSREILTKPDTLFECPVGRINTGVKHGDADARTVESGADGSGCLSSNQVRTCRGGNMPKRFEFYVRGDVIC